jgi:WD40 repeat protein
MSGEVIESQIPVLKPLWAKAVDAAVTAIDTDKPGYVAAGLEDGRITIHDSQKGEPIWGRLVHDGSVLQIGFSPSGKFIATTGEDGFLRIFDVDSKNVCFEERIAPAWAEHMRWSQTDDFIIAAAGKHSLGYSLEDKTAIRYEQTDTTISCLAWLNDQQFGAGCYGKLNLFKREAENPVRAFEWKGSLISLKFSPDGRYAVCGAQDQTIHIWDLRDGTDLAMRGFSAKPKLLDFHYSGNWMVNASGDNLTVWDFRGKGPAGKKPIQLTPAQSSVQVLKYQNEHHLFFTCDKAGAILLWSPRRSKMPVGIAGVLDHPANCAGWTPDDRSIIAGLKEGHVVAFSLPESIP